MKKLLIFYFAVALSASPCVSAYGMPVPSSPPQHDQEQDIPEYHGGGVPGSYIGMCFLYGIIAIGVWDKDAPWLSLLFGGIGIYNAYRSYPEAKACDARAKERKEVEKQNKMEREARKKRLNRLLGKPEEEDKEKAKEKKEADKSKEEKGVRHSEYKGGIVVTSAPPNAEIFLNSDFVGTASDNPISLAPGKYTLEIRKPGYKPWKRTVRILGNNVLKISVELEKE